jgi:hypothetical protein
MRFDAPGGTWPDLPLAPREIGPVNEKPPMSGPAVPFGLRLGSILLAVSALGILAAPIAIVRAIPDLTTRSSRHELAGALGLTALAILEFLLAAFPIRRGERWALVAAAMPFVVVGIPMIGVDVMHVTREQLWNTLAPQVFGLVLGAASWTLCAISMGARKKRY